MRDAVVVRGADAMAPRELIALALPRTEQLTVGPAGAQAGEGAQAQPADGREPLRPFERGPEITEVR